MARRTGRATREDRATAVIGMAGRFPGASGVQALMDLLEAGRDAVGEIAPDRWRVPDAGDGPAPRWLGALDDVRRFDHRFFGIAAAEAATMDPQQRILLEETWHCLEDAAVAPETLARGRTGVFVGFMATDFHQLLADPARAAGASDGLGAYGCILANRISHALRLDGPSIAIDAACASSLVALHLARRSLLTGECDHALVAGVSLDLDPWKMESFARAGMLSPRGRSRTFDLSADGYVPGEGAVVVLLRRAADAARDGNRIHARILGSAVNHTGGGASITHPSVESQARLIEAALADAGIEAPSVGYVEAHGTGTSLGDPIEVEALRRIYGPGRREPLRIGSLKSNLGHLEGAAGLAGLVKVVMMMRRGRMVPTLHVATANPILELANGGDAPVLADSTADWPAPQGAPRRAAVSSFGFGGANAHAVVEEAAPRRAVRRQTGAVPFLLSAADRDGLAALIDRWRDRAARPDFQDLALDDIAATLATGRAGLRWRIGALVESHEDIRAFLATADAATAEPIHARSWALVPPGDGGAGHRAMPPRFRKLARGLDLISAAGMAEALAGLSLRPAAVLGWGGRVDAAQAAGAVLGLPVMDPQSGALLGQRRPDAARLRRLGRDLARATAAGERVLAKAALLLPHQPTFARLVSSWDGMLDGLPPAAGLVTAPPQDAATRAVAVLVAATALRQLSLKWDLPDRTVARARCISELSALVAADALPRRAALVLLRDGDGAAAAAALGPLAESLAAAFGERWTIATPDPARLEVWRGLAGPEPGIAWHEADGDLAGLVMALWRKGENPDWARLFPPGTAMPLELPLYPFQGRDFPATRADFDAALGRDGGEAVPHPVVVLAPSWADPVPLPAPPAAAIAVHVGDGAPAVAARLDATRGQIDLLLRVFDDRDPGEDGLRQGMQALHAVLQMLARRADASRIVLGLVVEQTAGAVAVALVAGMGAALARESALARVAVIALQENVAPVLPAGDGARFTHWRIDRDGARRAILAPRSMQPAARRSNGATGKVAVITGGAGALGQASMRALAACGWRRFVLLGRRPSGDVSLPADSPGLTYRRCDVADRTELAATLAAIRHEIGPIGAVVHAAGFLGDGLIAAQDWPDAAAVLAPKLDGGLALDRLTRDDPLDLFAVHGSVVAHLGNAGQTAYAAANGALDGLIEARRAAAAPGRSLAFDWSFVEGGGMGDDETARIFREAGVLPLSLAHCEAVMRVAFGGADTGSLVVLGGPLAFDPDRATAPPPIPEVPASVPAVDPTVVVEDLCALVAGALGEAPETIAVDATFFELGLSSLEMQAIADELARRFVGVTPTALFQFTSVAQLAGHLATLTPRAAVAPQASAHAAPPAAVVRRVEEDRAEPAHGAADDAVAIIGMSGRFPLAPDLWAFWNNLDAGRDCIRPVPPERWARALGRGPDGPRERPRQGGFIDDVDRFEPLFFNLSPREAETMDPQQRLSLENVWHTLENAGYGRRERHAGRAVGIYWGTMWGEWSLYAAEQGYLQGAYGGPGSLYWAIPNRISYFMDFRGPSLALDTACSSSLTAIHMACRALADGDCEMAVAGGINLSLHPAKYDYLAQARFLSSDGRCRSFGEGGDGYVPGEGVASVLLKPLARARADGDNILGVVLGSAINHGGRAAGFTAPNPGAQAALIDRAIARAGIAPDALDYVECHGTGTALGDPIEIEALSSAMPGLPDGSLPIGSVKSNIGHLEAAAGIAGLIKVLLAFERQRLPASLHGTPANPNIAFADTPFVPLAAPRPWPRQAGRVRHAAISSFGAGGSNAHAVLAGPELAGMAARESRGPREILLAARSAERLLELCGRLAAWADTAPDGVGLDAIADSLRSRTPFAWRAAFLARDLDDLARGLRDVVARRAVVEVAGTAAGAVPPTPQGALDAWLAGGDPGPLPGLRPVSLPGTPFEDERYWLPEVAAAAPYGVSDTAPVLSGGPVGPGCWCYSVEIDGAMPLLRDHALAGRPVLAGALGLELVRAALARSGLAADRLEQVSWRRPVVAPACIVIEIAAADGGGHGFTLSDEGGLSLRGLASAGTPDIAGLPQPTAAEDIAVSPAYEGFARSGLAYGPAFRTLRGLALHADGLRADLGLAGPRDDALLPATLLDGALQAVLAWIAHQDGPVAAVPVAIDSLCWRGPLPDAVRVDGRIARLAGGGTWRADLVFLDGEVPVASLCGVMLRATDLAAMVGAGPAQNTPAWRTLSWRPSAHDMPAAAVLQFWAPVAEADGLAADLAQATGGHRLDDPAAVAPGAALVVVLPDDAAATRRAVAPVGRALARIPSGARVLVTARASDAFARPEADAFGGLLRAAALETGARDLRVMSCAGDGTLPELAVWAQAVRAEAGLPAPAAVEVRWRSGRREQREDVVVALPAAAGAPRSGPWVITGGLGALGLHLAHHLAATGATGLALVSRGAAAPGEAQRRAVAAIERLGVQVVLVPADAGDARALAGGLDRARGLLGPFTGAIHAAGLTRDGLLRNKTDEAVAEVLAPKLDGIAALDAATSGDPLQAFVAFASIAGVRGNIGQADYAYANRYLDLFMERRATLVATGERNGRSLSLDWPLWQDGGMAVDADTAARIARLLGSAPMPTAAALDAFDTALADGLPAQLLPLMPVEEIRPAATAAMTDEGAVPPDVASALLEHLRDLLAAETGLARERIDVRKPVDEYGVDSVSAMRMVDALSADFGELSRVLFFEHPTLEAVRDHLLAVADEAVRRHFGQSAPAAAAHMTPPALLPSDAEVEPPRASPAAHDEPIAIIGLAAHLPGADDLDAFWRDLLAGADRVGPVPSGRWDAKAQGGTDEGRGRYGAFLDDIAGFDPLVFGIAPRDARLMDPQARLFLEESLHALEDAGWAGAVEGRAVGVFAAAMWGQYELLGAGVADGPVPGSSFAEIANRVSHAFDLTGPSLAVDSMCSSSLTALHLACESLRRGECEMALAGGVNLSIRPEKYRQLVEGGFLSSDGRCRAFGEGGDGYVPGEGVAVALLKPLERALADGDPVRAVIRGSALNHGGRARAYTVPTPGAQAAVIRAAFERAGVSPDDIDYVEAHGTGTALGDPVEIAGLTQVFGGASRRRPIGSVKSQIGHLEAAAGIAAVCKLVLQFEAGRLAPSLHAETLNGNIDWSTVPFVVQREAAPWPRHDGPARPRRAVVSAFGAGGSNAHMILEAAPERAAVKAAEGEQLIVLSARSESALRVQCAALADRLGARATSGDGDLRGRVREVLAHALGVVPGLLDEDEALLDLGLDAAAIDRFVAGLHRATGIAIRPGDLAGLGDVGALLDAIAGGAAVPVGEDLALAELAWTLQAGRRPMAERVAIRAASLAALAAALHDLLRGATPGHAMRGRAAAGLAVEQAEREAEACLAAGDLDGLARAWVAGARVDWSRLHAVQPARLRLPGYPFERKPYWFEPLAVAPRASAAPAADNWQRRAQVYDGDAVGLSVEDGIATITLAEPASRNMFTEALTLGLVRALEAVAADESVRVVLLRAEGACFSMGGTPEILQAIAEGRASFTDAPVFYRGLLDCPVPVVAAMAGHAYGGGLLLGLYADMPVLAAESRYAAVFTDYGFTPGMGATLILPARLGGTLAEELMYAAEPVTGAALAARGAPLRIHPRAEVEAEALRLARSLARKPRRTLVRMKQAFAAGLLERLPETIAQELSMHEETFRLPEVQETLRRRFAVTAPEVETDGPLPASAAPTASPRAATAGRVSLRPVAQARHERHATCLPLVREAAAAILMMAPDELADDRALVEQGLDSIAAVELARRLGEMVGGAIDATDLYDHPTPLALAAWLDTRRPVAPIAAPPSPATGRVSLRPTGASSAATSQPAVASYPAPAAAPSRTAAPLPSDIEEVVAREAMGLLQMAADELDRSAPLASQGLDSIGAVELARALAAAFDVALDAADIYDHPSVAALAVHVGSLMPAGVRAAAPHAVPDPAPAASIPDAAAGRDDAVAIIGMAGAFPGAADVDAFWANLLAGVDTVGEVPPSRWDGAAFVDPDPEAPGKGISRWGGFLSDVDRFDAGFFGFSPMEAEILDPQQRLVLEAGWHALEDAAVPPSALAGRRCGIFMGAAAGDYERLLDDAGLATGAEAFTGLSPSILTARLAYALDLTGPAVALETACSSSLVAVHEARRALLAGDCDMALAGGVMVMVTPRLHVKSSKAGMLSPTGRCRPFSDRADGIALSEAVGVVVLKRLADARRDGDPVRAVILTSGVNQDGRTNGITAPSARSQAELLRRVYGEAGLDPRTVGYVETHGTGTALGDPIEFKALKEVFGPAGGEQARTILGASKASIGHATMAAGVAGLIAAVRAVETGEAPPLVHFETANSRIDLENSPFAVAREHCRWGVKGTQRRAAVSSFGFSGTNAHLVLEQAPARPRDVPAGGALPVLLSARDAEGLVRNARRLAAWLQRDAGTTPLADIAFTLACGRDAMAVRCVLVTADHGELATRLATVGEGVAEMPDGVWREPVAAWLRGEAADLRAPFVALGADWCRLPGHAFAETRFWAPAANPVPSRGREEAVLHPLVQRPIADPDGPAFETVLDPSAPLLDDHRVLGRSVLPGAALLSMALAAARQAGIEGTAAVRDLVWLEACEARAADVPVTLRTRLRSRGEALAFTIASADGDDHARGLVEPVSDRPGASEDLAALRARFDGAPLSGAVLYESLAARGLDHRGAFRRVEEILTGPAGEVLVQLRPTGHAEHCEPDPALLDAVLHGAAALLPMAGPEARLYLPVGLEHATFHAPLTPAAVVFIRRVQAPTGRSEDATARFDLAVWDAAGRPLARLAGFALRRVETMAGDASDPASLGFFVPSWQARPMPAAKGPIAVMVEPGAPWPLRATAPWDGQAPWPSNPVLVALAPTGDPASLFATARRTILAAGEGGPLTLVAHDEPAARALAGLARSLAFERPRLTVRVVLAGGDAAPDALCALAAAPFDGETLWRLDGSDCAVHRLVPVEAGEAAAPPSGVWLVTGGSGALGRAVGERLARLGVRPVLIGRGEPPALPEGMAARRCDVTDAGALRALVADIESVLGPVSGAVHLAAVLRDGLLAGKAEADWSSVIAPKVDGLLTLLDVLEGRPLQAVVAFSSMAAVQGHLGQTDYAFANGWIDGLAIARGLPLRSIAWPWWRAGGMAMDDGLLADLVQRTGIAPVEMSIGLDALERILAAPHPYAVAAGGDMARLRTWLGGPLQEQVAVPHADPADTVGEKERQGAIAAVLGEVLVDLLKVDPASLGPDRTFASYGLESITLTRYTNRLNRRLEIDLSPAALFEADTIARLAARIAGDHPGCLAAATPPAQGIAAAAAPPPAAGAASIAAAPVAPASDEPIAIVGLAARMPGSGDLDDFWRHLVARDELVTEVPADRWDWRDFAGDALPAGERTRSRWGGFLVDDVDLFDAAFFGISPREAELLDPQQRLFLETAWHALEDAGIAPSSIAGSDTGVFVGVATADYLDLMLRAGAGIEAHLATGMSHSMLPNRLSYLLDLHGPSEPVDTACSSSLVALARAVEAIRRGDCAMAIAGGVNLILSPTLYIAFDRAGMLSPTGRCRVFDAGADGYVRGEGVGAVVLKPLSQALAQGDPIHGVIRAIGVAHGGRASSLTAPNPNAQADLIARVVRRSGVDPADIGYVEAHGTGTPLGDPVEIVGLAQAFAGLGRAAGAPPVAVGSVKANIGHLEAAAGMAGLVKILLGLRHGTIPGQAGLESLNPHIRLDGTGFAIADETRPWPVPAPDRPRVAGLSSFGFGGANVHAVIAEAPGREAVAATGPMPVVLSARSPAALDAAAAALEIFLRDNEVDFAGLAWTLQGGREPRRYRLGFLARSLEEVRDRLAALRAGQEDTILRGEAGESVPAGDGDDAEALLQAWIAGGEVDWRRLWGKTPVRLPLPGTVFERKSFRAADARPLRAAVPVSAGEAAAPEPESAAAPLDLMLRPHWRQVAWATPAQRPAEDETVVAIRIGAGGDDLLALLRRRHGERLRIVEAGSGDIGRVLRESMPDRLYLIDADDAPDNRAAGALRDLAPGATALFEAVRTLASSGDRPLHLGVVVAGATDAAGEAPGRPSAAAVLGLARAVAGEHPDWCVRAVDLLGGDLPPARVLAAVDEEAAPVVRALDATSTWHGELLHEAATVPAASPFVAGGVHVILGGGGGIARALAPLIAARCRGRIALVGRRPADASVERCLAAVRAAGGEAMYLRADAQDIAALTAALARIGEAWDVPSTVIDAVMVLDDVALARMSPARWRAVFEARARTATAIEQALSHLAIRPTLIHMSSVQAFLGNPGQANYAAACAFVDAWAAGSPLGARTINWGYWGSVGAVAGPERRAAMASRGIGSIEPDEGLAVLEALLAGQHRRLVAARGTPEALARLGVDGGRSVEAMVAGLETVEAQIPSLVARRLADGDVRGDAIAPGRLALFAALEAMTAGVEPAGEPVERVLAPIASRHPVIDDHLRLLAVALDGLPSVLTGQAEGTEVLLPGGSLALVEAIYAGNPLADAVNRQVAATVAARLPARGGRLLEVGAGTGGTTAFVLDALAAAHEQVDYLYTDLSDAFVRHGRGRFADDHPAMRFARLDIERDAGPQGLSPGGFDVIVAANVVHATADVDAVLAGLRRLLAPGGCLVLAELTRPLHINTLTFGLLPGWWRAADGHRIAHTPLLAPGTWAEVLAHAGFETATTEIQAMGLATVVAYAPLAATDAPPAPMPTRDLPAAPRPASTTRAVAGLRGPILDALSDVLRIAAAEIDPRASYIDLGVDSILAAEVAARLSERFSVPVKPTELYNHPSVEKLEAHLASLLPEAPSGEEGGAVPTGAASDDAALLALLERLERGEIEPDEARRVLGVSRG